MEKITLIMFAIGVVIFQSGCIIYEDVYIVDNSLKKLQDGDLKGSKIAIEGFYIFDYVEVGYQAPTVNNNYVIKFEKKENYCFRDSKRNQFEEVYYANVRSDKPDLIISGGEMKLVSTGEKFTSLSVCERHSEYNVKAKIYTPDGELLRVIDKSFLYRTYAVSVFSPVSFNEKKYAVLKPFENLYGKEKALKYAFLKCFEHIENEFALGKFDAYLSGKKNSKK